MDLVKQDTRKPGVNFSFRVRFGADREDLFTRKMIFAARRVVKDFAERLEKQARANVRGKAFTPKHKLLRMGGGLLERSIMHNISEDGTTAYVGVLAYCKYARIHEFGGITHPNVTVGMRAWAWALYHKEVGSIRKLFGYRAKIAESMSPDAKLYKAIALTKKERLTIVIPARPYLRPAWDSLKGQFKAALIEALYYK